MNIFLVYCKEILPKVKIFKRKYSDEEEETYKEKIAKNESIQIFEWFQNCINIITCICNKS